MTNKKRNFKELSRNALKSLRIGLKYVGLLLIAILSMSGFIRFVELNSECEGFNNYYEFQNIYCNTSGLLNHKIKCEIPQNININCKTDLGIFSFYNIKTRINNNYQENYLNNISSNFTIIEYTI